MHAQDAVTLPFIATPQWAWLVYILARHEELGIEGRTQTGGGSADSVWSRFNLQHYVQMSIMCLDRPTLWFCWSMEVLTLWSLCQFPCLPALCFSLSIYFSNHFYFHGPCVAFFDINVLHFLAVGGFQSFTSENLCKSTSQKVTPLYQVPTVHQVTGWTTERHTHTLLPNNKRESY